MGMRKTSVALDNDLVCQAETILRTKTLRETIERALIEVIRAQARREEIEALSTLRGMDLADPSVIAGAWRS